MVRENENNDKAVIQEILSGDHNAFAKIMEKYQRYVAKVISKHIPRDYVEEVAQDVFIEAFQSLKSYRGKSSLQHWLATIAVRVSYKFWKKKYQSKEKVWSDLEQIQQEDVERWVASKSIEDFIQETSNQERQEMLQWALSKFSPEDKMVIELVYLEGLSGKEAAEMLGWTTTNVKVRAFRCRQKLKQIFQAK